MRTSRIRHAVFFARSGVEENSSAEPNASARYPNERMSSAGRLADRGIVVDDRDEDGPSGDLCVGGHRGSSARIFFLA